MGTGTLCRGADKSVPVLMCDTLGGIVTKQFFVNMDEISSEFLQKHYGLDPVTANIAELILTILFYIALFALCFLGWKLLQKLNKKIFQKLREKHGDSMALQFLEKLCSLGIALFLIIVPFNWDSLRQSIFGSAAVLTAIVGFAAQDVIKDILAGIQISIYKPFDIGDRIKLEDGTAGIVENITMRHVVIKRIDTVREMIPNSKMNTYSVINYSYDNVPRSAQLKFPVGYRSDIRKTKQVIRQAIMDSPYTIPGKRTKDGTMDYAPIYFIEIVDSALIMTSLVYFEDGTPTEILKDDVNTAVFEALEANGIEIPYGYTNVILKN